MIAFLCIYYLAIYVFNFFIERACTRTRGGEVSVCIGYVQFDDFEHMQTPIIPSPQSR